MKAKNKTVTDLIDFLNRSPSAWHAVENCIQLLQEYGFTELNEEDSWNIKPGGYYYVVRNGSSICAFINSKKAPTALQVAASHTDSPGFKLKPNAEFIKENMLMLGLEIYGGPLLGSWLNRDLGIAGRVFFKDKKGKIQEQLVNLDDIAVTIPQLAIHLDRTVNETGLILNKQEHLAALASVGIDKKSKTSFLERALKTVLPIKELLSFDLFLYPLEPARLFGEHQQLLASYRIDSLVSVHAALQGILTAKPSDHTIKMVAFWDHEEIGSHTSHGAGSPFLPHVIERMTLAQGFNREDYFRLINRSLCLSMDLTHAFHPNYPDKHEPRHLILLNKGIVIKSNAQYRYATDAKSAATIIDLCKKHKIPYQKYVARGDIPSGSTIGPIHAHLTGMATIDVGCPQLSMHSSREMMGVEDHLYMCRLAEFFFH